MMDTSRQDPTPVPRKASDVRFYRTAFEETGAGMGIVHMYQRDSELGVEMDSQVLMRRIGGEWKVCSFMDPGKPGQTNLR